MADLEDLGGKGTKKGLKKNSTEKGVKSETLADMSFSAESRKDIEEAVPNKRTRKKATTEAAKDEKAEAPKRSTKKTTATKEESAETPKKSTRKKVATKEESAEAPKKSTRKKTTEIVEEKNGEGAEVKEEVVNVDSIMIGNYENHGRERLWYDVVVRASDGSVLNFIFMNDIYGGCITDSNKSFPNDTQPIELYNPKETQLSELPDILTRAIFKYFRPQGNEEEYYKFKFGEELGSKVYQDILWANDNPISQECDVTLKIRDMIGSISDIRLDKVVDIRRKRKHSSADARDLYYTITDGEGEKWKVIVFEDFYAGCPYDSFTVERESEHLEHRNQGRRDRNRLEKRDGDSRYNRWGRELDSSDDQIDIKY